MKKERFKFIPYFDVANGSSTFEGEPCPSKEVIKLIGLKGLKKLDKKIKRLVEARIEMFGRRCDNLHGFSSEEDIYDTKKNISFTITEIIDDEGYSLRESKEIKTKNLYNKELRKKGNYYVIVDEENMSLEEYKESLNLIDSGLVIRSMDDY